MFLLFFISLTKWNIKMTAFFFIFLWGKKQSEEKFFISFNQDTILYTLLYLPVQGLCSHRWWLLQLPWITFTLHSVKSVLKFISSSIASIFPCIVSVPSEYIHATLIPVFTKEVALCDFTQAISSISFLSTTYSKTPRHKFLYSLFPIPDVPFSHLSIWFPLLCRHWFPSHIHIVVFNDNFLKIHFNPTVSSTLNGCLFRSPWNTLFTWSLSYSASWVFP